MIISKQAIVREYHVIRQYESQLVAIKWTAAKLGLSEQQVSDIVFEHEEVTA